MRLHLFIFRYWTVSVCPFGWSREHLWESCRYKTGDELKDLLQLKVMNFSLGFLFLPSVSFSLWYFYFSSPRLFPLTYTIHFYVLLLSSASVFLLSSSSWLSLNCCSLKVLSSLSLLPNRLLPRARSIWWVIVSSPAPRHCAYMSVLSTLMYWCIQSLIKSLAPSLSCQQIHLPSHLQLFLSNLSALSKISLLHISSQPYISGINKSISLHTGEI